MFGWFQRIQSTLGLQLPDVETSPMAQLFQAAMVQFRTSANVFNPREIIEEFIYLKEESAKFNSEAKQKGALAIVIRWIGWDIDLERERR